ncbi:ABC transporter substrate-binding protein [Marinicellulosiphila megalodicopiae]|uniref:ABC transporter substrate-binding protein n=1 Tax=Marinicellulosiphila megalodicopiae TaxID=2724896 RepID=UPI003BB0DED1
MSIKKIIATSVLATGLIFSQSALAKKVHVAVTAIVEHPALDSVRDGVKEVLMENGYDESNLKFTYESAQGQPAIAAQISRKLMGEQPDVIVAIATPSAQAAVSAAQGSDVPVVFSAVTDPIGAKLVQNMEKPGANVTGLSDMVNVRQHLLLMKEFNPKLKSIGVPYNPGESNSVAIVEALKIEAKAMGIKVVESAAPKSSDVMLAAKQLVGKVDAIYCPTDNTIISALESVVKVGIDAQIPVFAADTDSVERGVIAAVGYDYFDLGRQTGELVVQILKGEKAGNIAVKMAEGTSLFVNPAMAKKMGVSIPEAVLERATKVVE